MDEFDEFDEFDDLSVAEDTEYTEYAEPQRRRRPTKPQKPQRQSRQQRSRKQQKPQRRDRPNRPNRSDRSRSDTTDEDDTNDDDRSAYNKKVTIGIGIGAVVLVALVAFVAFSNKGSQDSDSEPNSTAQSTTAPSSYEDEQAQAEAEFRNQYPNGILDEYGNVYSYDGIYDVDGNVIDKDALNPGMKDFSESEQNTTTNKVVSADEYVSDINGVKIPAVYNVKSRDYIDDYVNYTTKRAIIDDGMEMYWLDVLYHEKKYRVQVPFYYFKDLQDEGICKVNIEVLTLEGGGKVISYMQVVSFKD